MIFRRSFSDPFRREMPAAGLGIDPTGAAIQSNQAAFMAQVARNNEQVAQWNAQRALQQGQVAEDQQRQKTSQAIGTQRALLASQGGDVGSGSDLDLVGDTARTGEFKAQTIRNDAQDNAFKYLLGANSYAGQASLDDSQASNAWTSFGNNQLAGALNMGAKSLLAMSPV